MRSRPAPSADRRRGGLGRDWFLVAVLTVVIPPLVLLLARMAGLRGAARPEPA
ncbi:MAG TPA: hypothetical protein VID68_03725 [Solirubrobacteraceae bacterium]